MRRFRAGFTLIELLVVLFIVGVLTALLLSAVQSARRAALSAQCMNNLRQMGLAFHNYESAHGILPRGVGADKVYSLHVPLLPYMDQQPLFASINTSIGPLGTEYSENATAARAALSVFACPADPYWEPGMTNYAGCLGDHRSAFGTNGVFGAADVRLGAITDGLSSTVAISEFLVGREGFPERLRSIHQPADSLFGPPLSLRDFTIRCASLTGMEAAQNSMTYKGTRWLIGQRVFTLYDNAMPPNSPSCMNYFGGESEVVASTTATSLHPNGCHAAFADGHVQFMSSSIDPTVWRSLGTRSGGEIVPSGSY